MEEEEEEEEEEKKKERRGKTEPNLGVEEAQLFRLTKRFGLFFSRIIGYQLYLFGPNCFVSLNASACSLADSLGYQWYLFGPFH